MCGLLFAILSLYASAIQAANLVVGQVGPLSGPEAGQGRAYGDGMELYFTHVNKSGGMNGNQFVLVRKDDGSRHEDTVSLTKELLTQAKPLVLSGYFGNNNISALLASNILQQEGIALVGYRSWEIRAETPYVYNVRAGLRDEITKLTEHLATIGITRLGLFYEGGPNNSNLMAAIDEATKKAKARIIVQAAYQPGANSIGKAANEFLQAQPQAVLLITSGATAANFIEQYRAIGGGAQIFSHSGSDIEQMAKRLSKEQLQGVVIAQVTPSPYTIASKVTKEFNDLVAQTGKPDVPVSFSMMEGFIAAKVIVEAVRRQGRAPTREGTAAALDAMDNYDVGGYLLSFKPGMRTGSHRVELSIVSGAGKIRQ
ncbi:ABC transporter substrate-binding protein [Variovorax sp. Varisp36]|uniref:ABC transporter substrate-binding protein n=1 Tax=Variovorax sp. Varisp36 TaxID=3243031 RepID=UPI0039A7652B